MLWEASVDKWLTALLIRRTLELRGVYLRDSAIFLTYKMVASSSSTWAKLLLNCLHSCNHHLPCWTEWYCCHFLLKNCILRSIYLSYFSISCRCTFVCHYVLTCKQISTVWMFKVRASRLSSNIVCKLASFVGRIWSLIPIRKLCWEKQPLILLL
jgi:hypothetical protein